jgi:hexosaminidase
MRTLLIVSALILHTFWGASCAEGRIIPRPLSETPGQGVFVPGDAPRIAAAGPARSAGDHLAAALRAAGCASAAVARGGPAGIRLAVDSTLGDLGPEGYALDISTTGLLLRASTPAGLFYGVQTIRQMLPTAAGRGTRVEAPCSSITDRPRFSWRGAMLDESRHFFGKEEVKRLLDLMALYKLNRFHWHLTDEPAWRIEIKKHPKLTSVGGHGSFSDKNAPAQFYTQDEVREIVDYAAARYIEVIPEIDMPGHATAANRAYPEFSGGGSEKHPDFTFHPGREGTYRYLEDILREVARLFPSPWLHLGGDEVSFGWEKWKDDPEVKALMQRESLASQADVEHYFIRRMSKVINRLGKTVVGWDEIADAGLDPEGSVVMWWRHDKKGQLDKALAAGFPIVLCPRHPLYFDFVQHESHKVGRRWSGFNAWERVYDFPNLPETTAAGDPKLILGMQANLWTETVQTARRMQFMFYPRLAALAEAAWTAAERKDEADFKAALPQELKRLEAFGVCFFNPFDPASTPEPTQ